MTQPDPKAARVGMPDSKAALSPVPPSKGTGSVAMALWQTALGIAVLLVWQGASGRLVDSFFISNPVDVGVRLYRWTADGSISSPTMVDARLAMGSRSGGSAGMGNA